jgi:hypothetical protein
VKEEGKFRYGFEGSSIIFSGIEEIDSTLNVVPRARMFYLILAQKNRIFVLVITINK